MVAGWSSGGSFGKINGHCYFTVIRAVFNINNQSTLSVISLWLSKVLFLWAPSFTFHLLIFEGCFKDLLESPRKLQVAVDQEKIIISSFLWSECFFIYKNLSPLHTLLFRNYLPLEKGGAHHLNKLESPSP